VQDSICAVLRKCLLQSHCQIDKKEIESMSLRGLVRVCLPRVAFERIKDDGALRKHALDLRTNAPELQDWLLHIFRHGLARGLHRWTRWDAPEANRALRRGAPVIVLALMALQPTLLAPCGVTKHPVFAGNGRDLKVALAQLDAAPPVDVQRELEARFERLGVLDKLLICTGARLRFVTPLMSASVPICPSKPHGAPEMPVATQAHFCTSQRAARP
jgi:hypothetical protein